MILLKILTILFLVRINRAQNIQPYITNGESVGVVGIDSFGREIIKNIGEFPYMVSVELNRQHYCGGVIIAENAVLTAEHCVHGLNAKSFQVKAGTLDLKKGIHYTEQILDVESITSHPRYQSYDNLNDIAILWLKGHFRFKKEVNKVNMPKLTNDYYIGEKLISLGWGSDKISSTTATLKSATLEVIGIDECRKMLWQWSVPNTLMCVIDKNYKQTTCPGDGGGPLVRHDSKNAKNDILIGLKSGGLCDATLPTNYADVGQLRNWILDEINRKKFSC